MERLQKSSLLTINIKGAILLIYLPLTFVPPFDDTFP